MYKCLVLALPGDGVRIEPITLGSNPNLSNGRERSKEATLELAAENVRFQRNKRSIH